MSDDTPYNKREIDSFVGSFKQRFDKLDTTLERIELNQSNTQSEIAVIKETIKDYGDIKKAVGKLTNYKYWLIGGLATFAALLGLLGYMINSSLDGKISVGINNYFNEHYSKVEVVQP